MKNNIVGSFIIHSFCYALTCLLLSFIFLSATSANNQTIASDFEKTYQFSIDDIEQTESIPYMNTKTAAYLAARFAKNNKDWRLASDLYEQALDLSPRNKKLDSFEEKTAYLVAITSGDFDFVYRLNDIETDNEELKALQTSIKGLKHIKENDFDKAEKLIASLPNDSVHLYFKKITMAWIKAKKVNPNAALKELNELPRLRKVIKNPLEDITYANILDYLNDLEKADEIYGRALSQHMTLASALNIANFYERNNKADKAYSLYEDIHAMRPNHDLSFKKVKAYKNKTLGESQRRIETVHDGLGYSLLNLATFLFEQKSVETSLVYAQMSLEIAPKIDETWLLIGDLMTELNQKKAAIGYYKHIAYKEDAVNSTTARLKLAEIYNELERHADVVSTLNHAYNYWPLNKDILLSRANYEQQYNQTEKALELYNQIEQNHKASIANDWQFHFSRALAHHELGQFKKAEQDLEVALLAAPNNPLLLNHLGYLWASQGIHLDDAQEMIEKALIIEPNNGYFLDSMGVVFYQKKEYQAAINLFENAIREIPYHADVLENLGDAYWQVGRVQEARFQWEKAQQVVKSDKIKNDLGKKIRNGLPESHKIGLRLDQ